MLIEFNKSSFFKLSDKYTFENIYNSRGYVGIKLLNLKNQGKYYYEITFKKIVDFLMFGLCNESQNLGVLARYAQYDNFLGFNTSGESMNCGSASSIFRNLKQGETVGMCLDFEDNSISCIVDGHSYKLEDKLLSKIHTWSPCFFCVEPGESYQINLGTKPFKYAIPLGFKAYARKSKYLIKYNNIYYSLKYNICKLKQPNNNQELEKLYKINGIEYLTTLFHTKNNISVNLELNNNIYTTTMPINFNEITDNINYINKDNHKEIKYNVEEYQLLDLIKEKIGSKFQIAKWEEK